jgi:very-short-patch-repair endonuclease
LRAAPAWDALYCGGASRNLRFWGAWPEAGAGGSMRDRKEENRVRKQLKLEQCAWVNRRALTESEARLWSALSARKLGVQFRREVPLAGRYLVDFCAPAVRLVVEVDGGCHARRGQADARRDAELTALGYRVVRVAAELVLRDLEAVIAAVRALL